MHHLKIAAAVATVALLISACVAPQQYRTRTVNDAGVTVVCDIVKELDTADNGIIERRDYAIIEKVLDTAGDCTIEHRQYTYKGGEGDYYLAFIEFDDQGWFWDRKQMEALLRLLYGRQKDGSAKDFLIFVHAHGWQHNASRCDSNVVCFQRLLERFDIMERAIKNLNKQKNSAYRPNPRKVIGVYVGWRGRSLNIPGIDNLSFWERKNTAERVGTGGVTELLTRLNDFRRYMNPGRSREKTQLIISGHSFGGEVIYSALSHSLLERAARMGCVKLEQTEEGLRICPRGTEIKHTTANSFGDLVVLVNPAFEGSVYEPLYHVATNRCYLPKQRPAMLIVTSEADQATKTAFPLGRWFSTLFETIQSRKSQIEQKDTILETVGHLNRYRTHELKLTSKASTDRWKPSPEAETKNCGCPFLKETAEFEISKIEWKFLKDIEQKKGDPFTTWPTGEKGKWVDAVEYGDDLVLVLNKEPRYAPNFPYLVISTGKDIIKDHNSIYSEHFTDFLRRFYIRHINARINFPRKCFPEDQPDVGDTEKDRKTLPACKPTAITPCVQSCQRADGSSCSGRSAESGSPAG